MECCKDKITLLDRIKSVAGVKGKEQAGTNTSSKKVALIGNPNVGKSLIFNSLTGAYVTVSNYPGTTVEVSRGWFNPGSVRYEVVDTPGMYSMLPISEEEKVTRRLLVNEKPDLVLHVIDAKNIRRMLPLTLQLMEADFNVALVLNIIDEANALGIKINVTELENILGIPVFEASAALNRGLGRIREYIGKRFENAA